MKREKKKMRKGAASFYVVAFSTLILMIIATSFAAIIISEVTRTMNDDLSQSAYDSAMAGIEDAKLAYYNYQNCLEQQNGDGGGSTGSCATIMELMNNADPNKTDCDMVAKMIGRDGKEDDKKEGVIIEESSNTGDNNVGNNMQQVYTCVTMTNKVSNYWSTLSSSNLVRVFKAKFDEGIDVSKINRVKLSWFSTQDATGGKTFSNSEDGKVAFSKTASAPPTVSLAMVQTSDHYTMSDFETTRGENEDIRTNRAMVYLVPAEGDMAGGDNYKVANDNTISAKQFAKSNDKVFNGDNKNVPYTVLCNGEELNEEFICSATIYLPKPVGDGGRNDDTFIFAIGLPYGEPETEISLEFFGDGTQASCAGDDCEDVSSSDEPLKLKDVQIAVDSTGRANDLYRRISVRLDNKQDFSLSIMGPLELLNDGSGESLTKDYSVRCEYNFGSTCKP